MKLWLDDVRPTPEGWVRAHSVNEAIRLVAGAPQDFEECSLDHDLGDYAHDGGDGVKFVDWMGEHNIWPRGQVAVHSANPVGRDNMRRSIDAYRRRNDQ